MEALAVVHPVTNTPLGVLPRAEAIASGAWCRSTNIFVMNSKGEILCHQRSMLKERMPGVWVTHLGGHVGADESYEENACKELYEEAGIHVPVESLIAWRTTKIEGNRLWVREYVALIDKELADLVPQPGEVDAFVWLRPEDIVEAQKADPKSWCAGTYDFMTEYHCLLAALAVASSHGKIPEQKGCATWHPIT